MKNRVVQFLMGLNECDSAIRTHVFAMPMDVVFEMASREESQRNATKARYVEASALYGQSMGNSFRSGQGSYQNTSSNNTYQGNQANENQLRQMNTGRGGFNKNKPRLFCTHCQMTGHLKESCYKLVGYPPCHKLFKRPDSYKSGNGRMPQANNVASSDDTDTSSHKSTNSFSNEQLNHIMAMIKAGGMDKFAPNIEMAGPSI